MPRIRVYARLRPSSRSYEGLQVKGTRMKIAVGDKKAEKFSSAQYQEKEYKFQKIFGEEASQDEVYEQVVHHMVERFLEGYNGTVFAYGQTASGKTYTIEGSARSYAERGIIPRALSHIYSSLQEREEEEICNVHISFMEIYQDTGYDLLNPGGRGDSLMVTLPKVNMTESSNGVCTVKNLTTHLASTEEVAINLLFQGCACRRVSETSMNKRSSRSHGVFTIMLTSQKRGSEVLTRSKLHLVDLAGSERVAKTGADGQVLQEAKYINLSLHCLEHVIVILQRQAMKEKGIETSESSSTSLDLSSRPAITSAERIRQRSGNSMLDERGRTPDSGYRSDSRGGFVPYRNSLLTMLLRDSLGGNCLTAMIATVSVEERNIMETISTCRFAQRVACISNKAMKNEELDDKAVIKKLRLKIEELETEVFLLRQGSTSSVSQERISNLSSAASTVEPLKPDDKKLCHQILYDFLHGKTSNPVDAGIDTPSKFQECLSILREIVLRTIQATRTASQPAAPSPQKQSLSAVKEKENSPSTQQTPPSSKKQQSKNTAQKLEGPKQTGQAPVQSLSPIPRSQLSSGFVSLKDEEATLQQRPHSPSLSPNKPNPAMNTNHRINKELKLRTRSVSPVRVTEASPPGRAVVSAVATQTSSGDPLKPVIASKTHSTPVTRQKKDELNTSQGLRDQLEVLSLKVKEENLRRDIAMVDEQLATQHAKVLQLEQKGTTNQELLLAEKIAEKQLKIKQTRLSQQLVSVEHHQKLQPITAPGTKSLTTCNTMKSPVNAVSPPHHQPSHTIAVKTAPPITEIQEDVEELRLLQMEKQLELKEAATRRRLMSLKQQLQNEANATAAAEQTSSLQSPAATRLSKLTPPKRTQIRQDPFTPSTANSSLAHQQLFQNSPPVRSILTTSTPKSSPRADYRVAPSLQTPKARFASQNESGSNAAEVQEVINSTAMGPELNYMTALKRQKARVTRMRQCMTAASIIQRAWRRHKTRTKLSYF